MHFSGVGVIPKKNGKLRLIHDLSSPANSSVNDGIDRADFTFQYTTIDAAVSSIMRLGPGAYLTKIDIRNAFRLCPVHPSDWYLLGIKWQDKYYHDKVLPFGLRSAPYIFNCLAESIEWIIRDVGHLADIMHYLDDYLNVSAPSLPLANQHRSIILDIMQYLNVPIAPEKVEGPSTCLVFLGIELDTVLLEMRLPQDKLQDILSAVRAILERGTVPKRELVSVLGKLSFAARAIPSGRTFLRRLFDLTKAVSSMPRHRVLTIPAAAREDLTWWVEALSTWNGKSFFLMESWTPAPNLQLQTDASGTIGYGAYYNGRWLHGTWSEAHAPLSIEFKELYAIVVACNTWASNWSRLRIQFHCDNSAVVVRALYHICVQNNFILSAVHIPGTLNNIADALSRGLLQRFHQLAPMAASMPDTPVLPRLG